MINQNITAGSCGGITIGATYNCNFPLAAGANTRLILVDKDVYDLATISKEGFGIINIVAAAAAPSTKFYAFEGIRRSVRPKAAYVPGVYTSGFDHQIEFQIFNISQLQKDNIAAMGLSRMVAIVEGINSAGNGDTIFEVFGENVGMELQGGDTRINTDVETGGSFSINLKTSGEGSKETRLPSTFSVGAGAGGYAATKVIVDGLIDTTP